MTNVLDSNAHTPETAPGGFSLGGELPTAATPADTPPCEPKAITAEEIHAAELAYQELMAQEGIEGRLREGLNDLLSKDPARRQSEAAGLYATRERLLGVANQAFDRLPSGTSVRTVIAHGTPDA